jgi:hypothetical protein
MFYAARHGRTKVTQDRCADLFRLGEFLRLVYDSTIIQLLPWTRVLKLIVFEMAEHGVVSGLEHDIVSLDI